MIQDLPEIPRSWRWGTLGEVVTHIEAGKSFKCDERPPTSTELGIVKVSAVTWGTFDEEASKTCLSLDQIRPGLLIAAGDFLFSRANTIQLVGACVIVHQISKRLMLSDKILRLTFRSVYPPWVLYVLRSLWGRAEIERLATGNQESMRNIGQDRIRAIRVPFPPIEEQHRIIGEIEKQFTRIDAGVAALRKIRSKMGRYRLAAFEAAFASCAGIAKVRLGDLGEVVGGLTKGQKRKPGTTIREVPYLRVANVQRGYLDLTKVKLIEATDAEIAALRLRPGDILLNEGGDRDKLGRGWLWEGQLQECIHQNHVFRVRLDQSIALPKFVSHYANHFGQTYFVTEGRQTTNLASISISKLRNLPVPIPGVNEQKEVLARLEDHLSLIEDLDRTLNLALVRSNRLRQSILDRAFQGRLQTDPAAPPERLHSVEALIT